MRSTRQSDFHALPVWWQARHFTLAIAAMGDGFPRAGSARQWVRRMEQASLTMLSAIAAAYDGQTRFREARRSIDRLETMLQHAAKKKLLTRVRVGRLSSELDSVRKLLAAQETDPMFQRETGLNSIIHTSTGVSHD